MNIGIGKVDSILDDSPNSITINNVVILSECTDESAFSYCLRLVRCMSLVGDLISF